MKLSKTGFAMDILTVDLLQFSNLFCLDHWTPIGPCYKPL